MLLESRRLALVAFVALAVATSYAVYRVHQVTDEMCVTFREQTAVFARFVAAHAYTHGNLDPRVRRSAQNEINRIRSADCR